MKRNLVLVVCLAAVFLLVSETPASANECTGRREGIWPADYRCGCDWDPICINWPPCDARHNPTVICTPCGGAWQPPCLFESPACDQGTTNTGVLCVPCGKSWHVVCPSGDLCEPGHNALGLPDAEVLCAPCGGQDQPLCWTGDACRTGFEVEGWTLPLCTLEDAPAGQPESTGYTGTVPPQTPGEPLWGWADIHEHQFANMAYGGVTLWGDVYHEDGVSAALAECDWTEDPAMEVVVPTYWGIPADPPAFLSEWLVGMLDHMPTEYAGVDLTFLRTSLEGLESDLLSPLGPVGDFLLEAAQAFHDILPWDTNWVVPLLNQLVDWLQAGLDSIIEALEPASGPLVHLLGPAFVRGLYVDLAPWDPVPPVLSQVPRNGIHGEIDADSLEPSQFWLGLTNNISVNDAPYIFHGKSGYPSFSDWPSYKNGGHQQMYYNWVKRAYQGGLRLLVNFTVNNEALCEMSFQRQAFASSGGCEDMSTVDRQIDEIYALQQFIDDQCGSPGCGWYRVVTSAQGTREVIEQGKLAVIIGIEVDNLFNCKVSNDECDAAYVRAKVQEYYDRGVRYMFPVHFWDNRFTGSALYGDMFTYAQTLTGGTCPLTAECGPDGYNYNIGGDAEFLDFIFEDLTNSLGMEWCGPTGNQADCNTTGLQGLGYVLMEEMMQRDMLIDVDHLSRPAFDSVMSLAEQGRYPVISSHPVIRDDYDPAQPETKLNSELTHDVSRLRRIRDVAGVVAVNMPRGDCNTTREFVDGMDCYVEEGTKKCRTKGYRDIVDLMQQNVPQEEEAYPRIAMVADMGAFLKQPGPRFKPGTGGQEYEPICEEPAGTKLDYPFPSFDGTGEFAKLVTGDRTFDYNTDGLAHFGLLIDLVADVRNLSDNDATLEPVDLDPLFHSAEAFVRTWERIEHCTPDVDDPTIDCPPALITTGGVGGTTATYDIPAEAWDYCDWSEPWTTAVAYQPPSGSHFSTGVTAVTSTATDTSANTSSCQFDVQVSCLAVNGVQVGTKEGEKGKIEVNGTFRPATSVDATAVDVTFTVDDGNGHLLTFAIPAGSFEVRGNPDLQMYTFDSPSQSQPGISATLDFSQYTFDLKVKDLPGTSDLVGNRLTIGLETGQGPDLNYGLETLEAVVTPQHLHYQANPKLDCSP